MCTYKKLASDFIKNNHITKIEDKIGIVIYAYLLKVENKVMATYHSESKSYCYQLTDGSIGTLPMCAVNKITEEILMLN